MRQRQDRLGTSEEKAQQSAARGDTARGQTPAGKETKREKGKGVQMSTNIEIVRAGEHREESVSIRGHIHTIRNLGRVAFVNIRDQSGILQVVIENDALMDIAADLTAETVVQIEGVIRSVPGSAAEEKSTVELAAAKIVLLSEPAAALPVELSKPDRMKKLALNTLLDYRPITLRSAAGKAIFKLESILGHAFRQFLSAEGFTEIHSPKLVSTGTEGGANLFSVDYFGRRAFLAQSPQFYKQIMVGVFERVFEIGPVYRAEEHDTTRHLNEYVSMDLEMGFIDSEQDLIEFETRLLNHMFAHVQEHAQDCLALFEAKIRPPEFIPQITYFDAVRTLQSNYAWRSEQGCESAPDLDPESERMLCEHFQRTENCDLVFVTKYPHEVRPFYAMPCAEGLDARSITLSRSFDLLYRGLEITTGGQRIHRLTDLTASIRARGMDPEKFQDYLQCFRFGMPPHGGLAIGLERLAKQILQLPNIKMAALFPRDRNRLTP
jgi:nondiscriminating aspartyl-tRNA synthetase